MPAHMFAFCIDQELLSSGSLYTLTEDARYHHFVHVLKGKKGQQVILFNQSYHAQATVIHIGKHECVFLIDAVAVNRPLVPRLTLMLPLLKGSALDDAIMYAAQVGVSDIQLVSTEYTQRVWHGLGELKKYNRVLKIVAEQTKQFAYPSVHEPMTLEQGLHLFPHAVHIVARVEGASLRSIFENNQPSTHIVFFVGPEADFSSVEYELFTKHGCLPVSLGPIVLRASVAVGIGIGALRAFIH